MEAKYIDIGQFNTVNTYFRPFKIKNNELAMGLDIDLREDGRIKQRKGTELVEAIGTNVDLFKFNEIRDGVVNELLLAIGGTDCYLYNDGTGSFDLISSSLSSSNNWGGVGYVGDFIFGNGTNVYQFHYDSGTSSYIVTDVTGTANIPKATKWEVFANRIFATADGTENVYYSAISDPYTWDANDFFAMSGMPRAISAVGDFLFIGTDRGLYKLSRTGDSTVPFQMDLLVGVGVVPDSIVEVKSATVGAMLTDGRFIVFDSYIRSGSQIEDKIGLPVKNIISGIDTSSNVMCENSIVNNKVLFSMSNSEPLVTYDDSAITNYTLVFNNEVGGWSFYSLHMKSFTDYKEEEYYSDFSGNVYRMKDTLYQDAGVEFNPFVKTKTFDAGKPFLNKNFREFWITANPLTKTNIKIGMVNSFQLTEQKDTTDDFYSYGGSWGSVNWGEFIWGGTQNQVKKSRIDMNGKGLQFWITKNRDNSDFQVTNIVIKYFPSYQSQTF